MPTHPCIFCSKSYSRLDQSTPSCDPSRMPHFLGARRIAVPFFNGRVSPVLDTCTQLYLIESGGIPGGGDKNLPMRGASIFERAAEIKKLDVQVIICGAVSESFYNLLRDAGIDLVCGITGDIDEVITAHRDGTLGHARFRMPGSD